MNLGFVLLGDGKLTPDKTGALPPTISTTDLEISFEGAFLEAVLESAPEIPAETPPEVEADLVELTEVDLEVDLPLDIKIQPEPPQNITVTLITPSVLGSNPEVSYEKASVESKVETVSNPRGKKHDLWTSLYAIPAAKPDIAIAMPNQVETPKPIDNPISPETLLKNVVPHATRADTPEAQNLDLNEVPVETQRMVERDKSSGGSVENLPKLTETAAATFKLPEISASPDLAIGTDKMDLELRSVSRADISSHLRASDVKFQKVPEALLAAISNKDDSVSEIHLNPPELGKLKLTMTRLETGLTAVIQTTSDELTAFLQRHAQLLEGELRQSGFERVALNFSTSSEGGGNETDSKPHTILAVDETVSIDAEDDQTPTTNRVTISGGLDARV